MRTFKDANGREWCVRITTDTIRRCRAEAKVDPLGILSGDLIQRLSADVLVAVDMLTAILKPDLDKAGVTAQQFGDALMGDQLADATTALLEAIADFSPSQQKELIHRLLAAGRRVQTKAAALAMEKVREMEVASLPPSVGANSGGSPDSSESTPRT